jgi:predicted ATPase/DNA-binding CsgD family transcriptional regulator
MLIATAVTANGGIQPPARTGDASVLAAFARPRAALAAAIDAQRALAREDWAGGAEIRVRMAIHSSEAELHDGDTTYVGEAIDRCARLRDLARGGQVLVSNSTAALSVDRLPPGAALVEVSTCTLAGFERPERVHQLRHPDLDPAPASLRSDADRDLPRWPTTIVGREREIADVSVLLAETRVVTITGAGGSGKTRLAREVASRIADRFRDGVAWTELAPATAGTQVAAIIASACRTPVVPGVSAEIAVLHHLAKREMLVVLDNCEHLLDDCAALVAAILRDAPETKILTTSREPLGTSGEVTWRIPSLTLPDDRQRSIPDLMACDAVRLFMERGRAAQPDFRADDDNAALVAQICRRLDGMPLAIELAAARLRSLSIRQLAEGLDDRFRVLTGGARTAVARQRTLLASVQWSYELLDAEERSLFRRLGIFAAPFTIDAAEAVGEDDDLDRLEVLDVLGRLVDKSLVHRTGERYRLLETLRQFALERATDAAELVELRNRHLEWCRRRARNWRLDREPATHAVLADIGSELRDLVAALEWSLDPNRPLAREILEPLGAYYTTAYLDFDDLHALATATLSRYEPGSSEWLEVLAPIALALFFAADVDWIPTAREALDRMGDRMDPLVRGWVEFAASQGFAYSGKEEGFAGLRRAIEDGRSGGSRALELHATAVLAMAHADLGDCAAARPLLAWLDHHVPSDVWVRNVVELARTTVLAYIGQLEPARAFLTESLATHMAFDGLRRAGDIPLAAAVGCWMTDVGLCQRTAEAAERTPAAGLFALVIKDVPEILYALVRDDVDAALRRATAGLHEEAFGGHHLWIRCESGQMALTLGDLAHAEAAVTAILPHLDDAGLYFVRVSTYVLWSQVAAARGERAEAESRAHDAVACASERELHLLLVDALETLAVLLADTDRPAEAARLLGASEAFRARAGYRWRYPHQRRAIESLHGRVDPAHLAEGARLSLPEAVAYTQRGRGERRRPAHGWESLTASEQRVVALVAAGLPNREIAAKLFVSVATIKTHLLHVYGKLDIRTRAELAAVATRRTLAPPATR